MDLEAAALNPVTVTEYMSDDHQAIDGLLVAAAEAWSANDRTTARLRLADYASRLRRHIRLEEELLFPLFEARTRVSGGPTIVLRDEHHELERIVAEAHEAAATGIAFLQALAILGRVVDEHCVREQRVLFPMLDRQLLPGERAALVARLARE